MASINYGAREISVKIVYYGPGLSGKTTNLQVIHRKIPPEHKSDMVSLATEQDRTLFFDFLPLDLGTIKGFSTKFQLYTVPGQVYYNATRKLVLRGVDGVVFVADSGSDKIPENLESFQNLEDNLAEYHYKREEIPIIIQYNKRDLPNALPVEELDRQINKYSLPWTEAVANKGVGVFDSLKLMGKIVIDNLNRKYSRLSRGGAAAHPAQPPAGAQQYPGQQPMASPPQQQYGQQPQQRYAAQAPSTASYQQQQYQQPPQQRQPFAQPGMPFPAQQAPMPQAPVKRAPAQQPPQYMQQSSYPNQQEGPQFNQPQRSAYPPPRETPRQQPEAGNQQQFGFVNFEPLPMQQSPARPSAVPPPPARQATRQMPVQPDDAATMEPAHFGPAQDNVQDSAPGQPRQATPDIKPRGNAHTVAYPQKQRPVRTQIDERDYNVYHVDSSESSFPRSRLTSDSVPVEDTDIRMQKKLNPQAGKQQKRFLSKFFNRDDE
jgi:signal recognition particle receptor subunit beta